MNGQPQLAPESERRGARPEPLEGLRLVPTEPASPEVHLRFLRFELESWIERQREYLDSLGVPHTSTPKKWFRHLPSCSCAKCTGWTALWYQTRARQMRYSIAMRKLRSAEPPSTRTEHSTGWSVTGSVEIER